jgi:hypothetical protein
LPSPDRRGRYSHLAKLAHVAPNLSGAAATALVELSPRQADPSPISERNLYQPMPEGTDAQGGRKKQNGKLVAAALGESADN